MTAMPSHLSALMTVVSVVNVIKVPTRTIKRHPEHASGERAQQDSLAPAGPGRDGNVLTLPVKRPTAKSGSCRSCRLKSRTAGPWQYAADHALGEGECAP